MGIFKYLIICFKFLPEKKCGYRYSRKARTRFFVGFTKTELGEIRRLGQNCQYIKNKKINPSLT